VIGNCHVGDRSIIAQGTSVVDRDTPGDRLVFQGERGSLNFAQPRRDILADFFRDLPAAASDQKR
jgi:serine O-acetyltransferase